LETPAKSCSIPAVWAAPFEVADDAAEADVVGDAAAAGTVVCGGADAAAGVVTAAADPTVGAEVGCPLQAARVTPPRRTAAARNARGR